MRPTAELVKITTSPLIQDKHEEVVFDLELRGCQSADSVQISPQIFPNQSFSVEAPNSDHNTLFLVIKLRATIEDSSDPKWASPMQLTLNIQCDSHIFKSKDPSFDSASHFYRARSDANFSLKYREFSLNPIRLDNIKISNFIYSKVQDSSVFQSNTLNIQIVYTDTLYIEVKGETRFRIDYDRVEKTATMNFIEVDLNENKIKINSSQEVILMDLLVKD